jgi:predicted AAA+ superfamily ATPase
MQKEYINRLIYEYNPQLTGKKVELPEFKRYIYFDLLKWLEKKQIVAITGLRRVGKTTLMKQLMQQVDKAFYFSFDEEETQTKETLVYVIDFFINHLKAKYIFLDEVHYVKDWQGVLKRYYDTKGMKFIVSGSESLEIAKAKESLAGRIVSFKLNTLSFREFLELKGKKLDKIDYNGMLPEKEFFENEFLDYLYKGAFPEIVNEKDEDVIRKYISELVVKKIIYGDIPRIFEVKRKDLLYSLFKYLCDNSGNLFEIRNLCNIFNADYETITNYLFYLREAFLIRLSEVYSKSMAKRLRRNKKIYVVHPSIAFAVLGYKKEMLIEKILGQYVESLLGREFFWRDKHKNEVDIIIQDKTLLPVEVKLKGDISRDDLKGLLRFMDMFKVNRGIVVTRDILKEKVIDGKKVDFIPAWYFSLSRG